MVGSTHRQNSHVSDVPTRWGLYVTLSASRFAADVLATPSVAVFDSFRSFYSDRFYLYQRHEGRHVHLL